MRQLKDFHPADIDAPEKLFSKAHDYYQNIATSPNSIWLPVKKQRSVFVTTPSPTPSVPAPPIAPRPSVPRSRAPKHIDRCAPADGEPTNRVNPNTGREEFLCSKCPHGGRWGNHDASRHDQWLAEYRKYIASKKQQKEGSGSASLSSDRRSSSSPPPSQARSPDARSDARSTAPRPMSAINVASMRRYVSFADSDDEDSI